jgi:hypothetical protein
VSSIAAAVAALLVAAVLGSACEGIGGGGGQPTPPPGTGYAVVVRHDGKTAGRFDVAALRAMPAVDVPTPQSQGKQVQHGPTVRAVLSRAGVKAFKRVRAVGLSASQTFTSAEIDDQVVLDFDNRGTMKLAGGHLSTDRWVREVTELDADS